MKRARPFLVLLLLLAIGGSAYYYAYRAPTSLVLTGVVTTNDVVVSPQMAGQIQQLLVTEGDAVKKDQLLAVLTPDELRQERAFYTQSAQGATSQVRESEAEATLSATEAQRTAAEADLENARLNSERQQKMTSQGISPMEQFDQARTAFDAARARVASLARQVDAQRSAEPPAAGPAAPSRPRRILSSRSRVSAASSPAFELR